MTYAAVLRQGGEFYKTFQTKLLDRSENGQQTFTIPVSPGYKALFLHAHLRYSSNSSPGVVLRFGSSGVIDSASNYEYQQFGIANSGVSPVVASASSSIPVGSPPASTGGANYQLTTRIEIYNPFDSIYKNVFVTILDPQNLAILLYRGIWKNVSVMDQIQFNLGSFDINWDANSLVRLFGER